MNEELTLVIVGAAVAIFGQIAMAIAISGEWKLVFKRNRKPRDVSSVADIINAAWAYGQQRNEKKGV